MFLMGDGRWSVDVWLEELMNLIRCSDEAVVDGKKGLIRIMCSPDIM